MMSTRPLFWPQAALKKVKRTVLPVGLDLQARPCLLSFSYGKASLHDPQAPPIQASDGPPAEAEALCYFPLAQAFLVPEDIEVVQFLRQARGTGSQEMQETGIGA
jgi:hypothetical protein